MRRQAVSSSVCLGNRPNQERISSVQQSCSENLKNSMLLLVLDYSLYQREFLYYATNIPAKDI